MTDDSCKINHLLQTRNGNNRPAIVLLSGGLDSSTVLAYAKFQGFALYALSFNYGQKNQFELDCAQRLAQLLEVKEHRVINLDLAAFGGSSLTGEQEIERFRSLAQIGQTIPSTYVPARNTLFLSFALAWLDVLSAGDIFIGVNAIDTSGYPDCRPEYIQAYTAMANLATRTGSEGGGQICIHTPLQYLGKKEIVLLGKKLGVDFSATSTCYQPGAGNKACGTCDACVLRKHGFAEAGEVDPLNESRN